MGDAMGRALAAQGERVRVYVPFGETLPGMAYLVRRLLENTSNDSFIRKVELDDTEQAKLLMKPLCFFAELKHFTQYCDFTPTLRQINFEHIF